MEITPQILFGNVMHKRLFPKVNQFKYKIYYLSFPLSTIGHSIENKFFKTNRWGLLSFYNKDHGQRKNTNLQEWAQGVLQEHGLTKADGEIALVTMPRVFGYVFNPVSFWYCLDKDKGLRAVICEVNNTFGETHSYICAHEDQSEINNDDILIGKKVFHVSPFIAREGFYKFQFINNDNKISISINLFDDDGKKLLLTNITGKLSPLSENTCKTAFFTYPLITFKSILLIHWQAMKLLYKKIVYISKPDQIDTKITKTLQSEKKE